MKDSIPDIGQTIAKLEVLRTSQYRSCERLSVDCSDESRGTLFFSWEESSAGSDPYSWSEEYYRIGIPLSWFKPLMELSSKVGNAQGVVPARYWRTDVYVNTYTGSGGTEKVAPEFDEKSWSQDLVLVRLSLTPTTLSMDYSMGGWKRDW